jgi:hypothetical protein
MVWTKFYKNYKIVLCKVCVFNVEWKSKMFATKRLNQHLVGTFQSSLVLFPSVLLEKKMEIWKVNGWTTDNGWIRQQMPSDGIMDG